MNLRREFRNDLQALQQGEPAMAMKFADLWRWDGKVGRGKYAAVGLIGVVIKHNLDRLIAGWFLGYEKSFFNYWAPLGKAARHDHLSNAEAKFLATLLLFSIPFLWVGVGNRCGSWCSFLCP